MPSLKKARKSILRPLRRLRTRSKDSSISGNSSSISDRSSGLPSAVVYPATTSSSSYSSSDIKDDVESFVLVSPVASFSEKEELNDSSDGELKNDVSFISPLVVNDDAVDLSLPTPLAAAEHNTVDTVSVCKDEVVAVEDNNVDMHTPSVEHDVNIVENQKTPIEKIIGKSVPNGSFIIGDWIKVVKKGHKKYGRSGQIVKQTKCYVFFKDYTGKETIKIYRSSVALASAKEAPYTEGESLPSFDGSNNEISQSRGTIEGVRISDKPTDFTINSTVTVVADHRMHGCKVGKVVRHTAMFIVVVFEDNPNKECRIMGKFLIRGAAGDY